MFKVVLIDDDEIVLDKLETMLLEVGGFSVELKFRKLDEALTYLTNTGADLVFVAIEMQRMNGFVFSEWLALQLPDIPIIFMTFYQEYAVKAYEVNAFGCLLKPISKERLTRTLERYKANRLPIHKTGKGSSGK